jgi:hypothetical protein
MRGSSAVLCHPEDFNSPTELEPGHGELDDPELTDPAGQSIDVVREVRDDIKARIQTLVSELLYGSAKPVARGLWGLIWAPRGVNRMSTSCPRKRPLIPRSYTDSSTEPTTPRRGSHPWQR